MSDMQVSFKLVPSLDLSAVSAALKQLQAITESMSVDNIFKGVSSSMKSFSESINVSAVATEKTAKSTKQVADGFKSVGASAANASKSTQKVSSETANTADKTKAAAEGFKAIDESAKKAYESTKKVSDETKHLPSNTKESVDKFKAIPPIVDDAGKTITRAFDFNQITQAVGTVADSFSSLTAPVVAMDTATAKIRTLGGLAKENAGAFKEMSLEMSKDIPLKADVLQTATYEALSAGINATEKDIRAFMDASAKLAVGGSEDVNNTVNVLSSMVNAYGESADKATEYSDILFQTVNVGKTSIPELASSLSHVVPTAAAMGYSLRDVGAALALMTANGIPTAQATTKLNQLLIEIQKPGAKLAETFKNAGISAASLGEQIKSGDVVGALGNMKSAFEKAGLSATQAFSSTEASAAFNTLTKDMDNLSQFTADVGNSAGATEAAYNDMANTMENRVAGMKANLETFIMSSVDGLGSLGTAAVVSAQSLKELAPTISAVAGIRSFIPEEPMKAFDDLKKRASETGQKVLDFGKIIGNNVSKITSFAKAQSGLNMAQKIGAITQHALNLAMAANPVATVITAVTVLSGVLVVLYKNCDGFRNMVDGIGETVMPILESIWAVLKKYYELLYEIGAVIVEVIIAPFRMAWSVIDSVCTAIANWLFPLKKAGEQASFLQRVVQAVKDTFSGVVGVIQSIIDKVKGIGAAVKYVAQNSVGVLIKALKKLVSGDFSGAFNEIKNGFGNVANAYNDAQKKSSDARKKTAKSSAEQAKQEQKTAEVQTTATKKVTAEKQKQAVAVKTAYEIEKASIAEKEKAYENEVKMAQLTAENARKQIGYKTGEIQKLKDELAALQEQNKHLNEQEAVYKNLAKLAEKTSDKEKRSQQLKEVAEQLKEVEIKREELAGKTLDLETNITANDDKFKAEIEELKQNIERSTIEANVSLKVARQSDLEYFDLQAVEKQAKNAQELLNKSRLTLDIAIGQGLDTSDIQKSVLEQQQAVLETEAKVAEARKKYQDALNQERIDAITDTAQREYEIQVSTLRKQYETDLEAAKNNVGKRMDAEMTYWQARKKAEDDYLQKTSRGYNALTTLAKTMSEFQVAKIDRSKVNDLKNTAKDLKSERNALQESYSKGTIDYEEYQDQLTVLQQQEADNRTAIASAEAEAQRAVWQGFKDTVSGYFAEMATNYFNSVSGSVEKVNLIKQAQVEREAELQSISAAMQAATANGNFILQTQLQAQLAQKQSEALELETERCEAQSEMYAAMGIAIGSSFAQMVIDGENASKALLLSTFKAIKAMIPLFAAQIMGNELSKLSFAGLATAAALIATLNGLMSVAEAAVNGAFKDGVVNYNGRGSGTSDSNIVRISRGESVLTAKATRHKENQALFEYLNKTGRSYKDFISEGDAVGDRLRLEAVTKLLKEREAEAGNLVIQNKQLIEEVRVMRTELKEAIQTTKLIESHSNYRVKVENRVVQAVQRLDLAVR